MHIRYVYWTSLIFSFSFVSVAVADVANVLDVSVSCPSSCTFSVTVQHNDTGWKHYANRWEILTLERKVLATRILHHPHVDEQPFTRSLRNVKIPEAVHEVIIRAHDSVHEYGGKEMKLKLPLR